MNKLEAAAVLAKIRLGDNRNLGDTDQAKALMVNEWHELIGHNAYGDALNAVIDFRRTETVYLQPAHINRLCKVAREARAEAQHHALLAPNKSRGYPRPKNDAALAAAWKDPVEYAKQEAIYSDQLMAAGHAPVFDTFLGLPPVGSGQ